MNFLTEFIFLTCTIIFYFFRRIRAKPGAVFSELDYSIWESIKQVYSINDIELAGYVHLEGYLYLNFIKNCGYFLLFSSLILCSTLIPLYGNLDLSSDTSLSNLSIKPENLYNEDFLILGICTLILSLGTYILGYIYFILPSSYPSLFPSVTIT